MSALLLSEATARAALIAAVIGAVATAKALASVVRTWIEQASRTHRLTKALEGTRPNQRPEIIMACSQLEGKPKGLPRDKHDRAPDGE